MQISVTQAAMGELVRTLWIEAMDRILAEQGMDVQALGNIRGWMTNIGSSIEAFSRSQQDDAIDSKAGQLEDRAAKAENENAMGLDSQRMLDFLSEVVPVATKDVAPPDRAQQVTYQQAQSVAGMTVMMLLFALTSCGSVLLSEREDGTLKRLFVQPISRNAVLLGKFLFVLVVGVCQMAILFTYGEWMFRVGLFRDPVTLVVLSLTWVATGGAFGMFLASVSRSTKQAESLASLLILMMAALGGCWFPLQMMNLPPLLDAVCKSTMTYWAMSGFQGMLWNQLEWSSSRTLVAIGWQLGWVVALTSLSVYFFRRNYCRG
ncbi:MAG: ABC transporter permease [Pirellulaceae bacterium]